MLHEAQKLRDTLQELAGQRRITLRLAASTVANSTFLPATLGPFLADYPEVDLQLTELNSRDVLRGVQAGEFDLGVYDGNLPTGGLVSMPFRDDRLVLLVPRDHPWPSAARRTCARHWAFPSSACRRSAPCSASSRRWR